MGGSGTGTPIPVSATFVVEDGTGLSTANSYLSVEDAATYHATYTGSDDWTSATDAEQKLALIQATQYLDAKYHSKWRGVRTNEDQALDWPRTEAEDDDGYDIDDESVPVPLEQACAELALRVVLGDDLLAALEDSRQIISESTTVGPISESKTYADGAAISSKLKFPKVDLLIKKLTDGGSTLYRG